MARRPVPATVALVALLGIAVALGLSSWAGSGGASRVEPVPTAPPARPTTSPPAAGAPTGPSTLPATSAPVPAATATLSLLNGATPAPTWLGTRPLPRDAEGLVPPQRTPPELRTRRIVTLDELPPPPSGRFTSRIVPVPADVAGRSTWTTGCPVGLDDLRYVTVSFRGFDGLAHTGELLVHRDVAADVVSVFRGLFDVGFPIERMHVTTLEELEAAPTGDGNTTSAFVCRSAVGSTRWSEHAYGRAIDVNPFQNPYVKGWVVLPELATAYTDRDRRRPGMITRQGPAVRAFADVGWEWGGGYRSVKDWMHFSVNGR